MREEWPELPGADATELDWLRFEQADVVSWRQAATELGAKAAKNKVAGDRWQRPHRTTMVTHSGPMSREQQIWSAAIAGGRQAVIGGLTAAELEGLRGYGKPVVELLIPAGRRLAPLSGVRIHRTSVLPASHVRWVGPPRTVMARSIVDAAAWARSDTEARAVVAAAVQQHRVLSDEVEAVVAVMPRSRRRALVLETVRLAAGGAHAVSELDLVRLCRRFRLPRPAQQVARVDASGRQRFLDAYWPEWRVHVEIDGAWHTEVRTWWADMQRQNDLWIAGDRILRFPAWALIHAPDRVAAQLHAALTAAGWHP